MNEREIALRVIGRLNHDRPRPDLCHEVCRVWLQNADAPHWRLRLQNASDFERPAIQAHVDLCDQMQALTAANALDLYGLLLHRVFIERVDFACTFHIAANQLRLWDTESGMYMGTGSRYKRELFEAVSDG